MDAKYSSAPGSVESTHTYKKRRVQLDAEQCQQLGRSEEGSVSLRTPAVVRTSSKDPNRGLYPRENRKRSHVSVKDNFRQNQMATEYPQPGGFKLTGSQYSFSRTSKGSPGKRKVHQSNKVTNYFSSAVPKSNEHVGEDPRDGNEPLQCTPPQSVNTTSSAKAALGSTSDSSPSSSQSRITCRMYSPLKKLTDDLFVCEHTDKEKKTAARSWPSFSLDDDSNDFDEIGATSFHSHNNGLRSKFDSSCTPVNHFWEERKLTKNTEISVNKGGQNVGAVSATHKGKCERSFQGEVVRKPNAKCATSTKTAANDNESQSPFTFKPITSAAGGLGPTRHTATLQSPAPAGHSEKVSPRSLFKPSNYSDKYGLLGLGEVDPTEEEKTNYFSLLPVEVIENIFCQLPMLDLALNVNRVCSQWNEIISDKRFIPWKKKYHKLKKEDKETAQLAVKLLAKNEMWDVSGFLIGLIRRMKHHKPVTAQNMVHCLKKHKKYECAEDLMKERIQDCIQDGTPSPWSLIAVLVIISETVYDIEEIIHCLLCAHSQCTAKEVIECLYRIAFLLLAFKKKYSRGPWNGIHYRLYYALYLHENASSANMLDLTGVFERQQTGQQSLMKYGTPAGLKMTHEQQRIINHNVAPGEVIKIIAFAGTGKTSTLIKYTQYRPETNFLLVVYNKAVHERNSDTFPRNVKSITGHALAFRSIGFKYKFKLGDVKVNHLLEFLPKMKGFNSYLRCKAVRDTISTFLNSADPFITTAHVPETEKGKDGEKQEIEHWKRMQYVEDASAVWGAMKNVSNRKVKMPHDGYLKLYQLSDRPEADLSQYDCILIDEAQDLTPAIADLLLRQQQAKILVGDPHQQIYAFRGAVNSMEQVENTHTFYLTQSFRFGPEIAYVANCVLERLKHEKKKTLVGSGIQSGIYGDRDGQIAILCRCNYTVFTEAAKKCCFTQEDVKVAFVGGTDGFGFPLLMEIYTLILPEDERKKRLEEMPITNRLLQKFLQNSNPFAALETFAESIEDHDLLGKIKIVKVFNNRLPSVVDKILSKTVTDLRQADVVLSTAHKSKGLEFNTVQLADDFLGYSNARILEDSADECNILYVAVTRAKKRLQMNGYLTDYMLKNSEELFEYPVSSKTLSKDGIELKCMCTGQGFQSNALTLVKRTVEYNGGRSTVQGGMYSPVVVHQNYPAWRKLLGTPGTVSEQDQDFADIGSDEWCSDEWSDLDMDDDVSLFIS